MFKHAIIASVALLSLLTPSSATFSWGACQEPATQSSFDASQYLGTWYEAARDSKIIFEYGECTVARYDIKSGDILRVRNTLVNPRTGNIDGVDGTATCKTNGRCKVGFFLFRNGDYRVLSTDYSNYSVVYGCSSYFFGLFKNENVWILSRAQSISASDLSTAEGIITSQLPTYALSNLHYTGQGGDCIYRSY